MSDAFKTFFVHDKDDNILGQFEYEYGYGVIARRQRDGAIRTFLTGGYRAAIGSVDCEGMKIVSVCAMARKFIRE